MASNCVNFRSKCRGSVVDRFTKKTTPFCCVVVFSSAACRVYHAARTCNEVTIE